jgi:hypothetical protein
MLTPLQELQQGASIVNYASVLPGTGKTRWAISKLASRVESKIGITFYVAPTEALLREVHRELSKLLSPARMNKYVKLILSTNGDRTANQIRSALNGSDDAYGFAVSKLEAGAVLLITHETFTSRLPHGYDEQGKPRFELRPQISVIFDEARKCNVTKQRFRIPFHIGNVLRTKFLPFESVNGSYTRLRTASRLDTNEFDTLFGDNKQLRKLRQDLLNLLEIANDDATQLFGKLDVEEDESGNMSMVLQVLLVPYQIFYGWKDCILLSAFFENSQMYHLLKSRDVSNKHEDETKVEFKRRIAKIVQTTGAHVILRNVTDRIVDPKRVAAVKQRYLDTSITYISSHTSFAQNHLKTGVMVDSTAVNPRKDFNLPDFYAEYRKLALERRTQIGGKLLPFRLASKYVEKGFPNAREIDHQIWEHLKTLPGLVADNTPLQWYARAAIFMSRKWYKQHGQEPKAIPITVNVGDAGRSNRQQRYWTREIEPMFFGKCLEVPMQSHGLNKFKGHDTIAFLATLNASPEVKELFAQLCPGYSADLDHTLDQCIQSLTRCSVRDTKAKTKPLLIVTDKSLATQVKYQLCGLPKLIKPKHFGIPEKDPIYLLIDEDSKARQRKRRERPSVMAKDQAYRSRADVKAREHARDAFYREHSKVYAKYKSQYVQVSKAKKKAPTKVAAMTIELEKLKAQWRVERPDLEAKFKAIYKSQGEQNG